MTIKDAAANSLLMFVAATCVVLIVKALEPTAKDRTDDATVPMRDGVRVYYFHSNARCPDCRTMEAYAKEAVQSGFADELKTAKIQWRVVNYETSGNEHFVTEHNLVAPNVVLVRFQDGRQVAWKSLPEVRNFTGNKAKFVAFVQTNLRDFLQGSEPKTPKPQEPAATRYPGVPRRRVADTGLKVCRSSRFPEGPRADCRATPYCYGLLWYTHGKRSVMMSLRHLRSALLAAGRGVAILVLAGAGIVSQVRAEDKPAVAKPAAGKPAADRPMAKPSHQVIVCYFHRTVRCPTCRKIGAYVDEAVKTGFAAQMKKGAVKMVMIDFQDEKSQKYVKAYKVDGPTLILLDVKDGKVVFWKPAAEVWSLIGKKDDFFKYVRGEVQDCLDGKPANSSKVEPDKPAAGR